MKIAIIHDYLREYGGAERVIEAFKKIFPEADVFVGFIDEKSLGKAADRFKDWQIKTTFLQKIPGIKKIYSPLRVLAPRAFSKLDLSQYDIIISSSNAYFAKAVLKSKKGATHFCYCHTPARSLYGYDTQSNLKKGWLIKYGGQLLNHKLRVVDFMVAQKVDVFLANSGVVQKRIAKFFRRESEILYPPVTLIDETKNFPIIPLTDRQYYLYVNRLNYAKHPELAVEVAIKHNLPLKVVGSGPMLGELKIQAQDAIATGQIEFLGAVDDKELTSLYAGAKALLYPVIDEDFGMVPIEAMAFGTPVIAHRSGGPTETIIDGKTGVFFDQLQTEDLYQAVMKSNKINFDETKIRVEAEKYSLTNFEKGIMKLIKKYHATD